MYLRLHACLLIVLLEAITDLFLKVGLLLRSYGDAPGFRRCHGSFEGSSWIVPSEVFFWLLGLARFGREMR